VFVWLSKLGTWGAIWIVLGLAVTVAWRQLRPLVLVVLADAASDGIAGLVKDLTHEHRPHLPHPLIGVPHTNSFPSGHTATSFACATVLSALVPRAAPAFVVLAAAIAYSRLYVGVHWPLDVAGGVVVGVATALLLLAVARRRSVRRPRRG
jgi:undecaprenyl-diphosphatase